MQEDVFGLVGTTIEDKYRIDAIIGEGGFGVVYSGIDTTLKRPVAVKCLKIPAHFTQAARELFFDRFRQEGELLAKLGKHPSIVTVYGAGTLGSGTSRTVPYLVMELLEGEELEDHLRARTGAAKGPYDERDAVALLRPAIDAVAFAHEAGVVHRDLKPGNLFIARGARGTEMKVLDFGIAKAMQEGERETHKATGSATGFRAFSPRYGAPEQYQPDKYGKTGPWTDVHALGLVLVELVTGRSAFDSDDMFAAFMACTAAERPTPRALAGKATDGFEAVCGKALARIPEDRYRRASELLLALDGLLGGAKGRRPKDPARRPDSGSPEADPAAIDTGAFVQNSSAGGRPARLATLPAAPSTPAGETVLQEPAASPRTCLSGEDEHGSPAPRVVQAPGFAQNQRGPSALRRSWVYLGGVGLLMAVVLGSIVYFAMVREAPSSAARDAKHGHELFAREDDAAATREAVTLFQSACRAGNPDGCAGLGESMLEGRGVAKDLPEARKLLERACDSGVLRGCTLLGSMLLEGEGGLAKDEARAVELYRKACDDEDMLGCSSLGEAYELGEGGLAKDEAKAVELYRKACDASVLLGCARLGDMFHNGRGGLAEDEAKAVELYRKACDGRNMVGCAYLGVEYDRGGGGLAKDPTKAVELFRKACDGGGMEGCNNLGGAYYQGGGGLAKDPTKAVELFRKACDGRGRFVCLGLAVMYENGQGGLAKDEAKAVELYRKGCDRGSMGGCVWLGIAHERGQGGLAKDEAKAVELYRKGCDAGTMSGCVWLGDAYNQGKGGLAKDEAKAVELYRKGCDAGTMSGCVWLGDAYNQGKGGLAKDEAKAVELYRKACDAGRAEGCNRTRALSPTPNAQPPATPRPQTTHTSTKKYMAPDL